MLDASNAPRIRATAYGALDRGYDLTLVEDAHTTETMELPDGAKIEAAGIVDDLNIAITCLSYPGRENRTVKAADVDGALQRTLPPCLDAGESRGTP